MRTIHLLVLRRQPFLVRRSELERDNGAPTHRRAWMGGCCATLSAPQASSRHGHGLGPVQACSFLVSIRTQCNAFGADVSVLVKGSQVHGPGCYLGSAGYPRSGWKSLLAITG
jgi:hypothetical protein